MTTYHSITRIGCRKPRQWPLTCDRSERRGTHLTAGSGPIISPAHASAEQTFGATLRRHPPGSITDSVTQWVHVWEGDRPLLLAEWKPGSCPPDSCTPVCTRWLADGLAQTGSTLPSISQDPALRVASIHDVDNGWHDCYSLACCVQKTSTLCTIWEPSVYRYCDRHALILSGTRLKWRYLRLLQPGNAFEIHFNHG